MGKKIFFLSLILLSVSMGLHWYKHKPQTPKRRFKPKIAINLEEMMLKDGETEGGEGEEAEGQADEEGEESEESENEEAEKEEKEEENKKEAAPEDENIPKSLAGDSVIAALHAMKRNPFETSPYAQLVEEIALKEQEISKPDEKKDVKVATGNFTATIKTAKELVAIIDSRLYRKGDIYNDMQIVDVKTQIIALKQGATNFILPKSGVKINFDDKTGQYTIEDSYQK